MKAQRSGIDSLAPRQRQVAELIAQGLSQKETAARLGLSAGTVKFYLSHGIWPKLGVTSQAELIRYWIQHVEMPALGDCSVCPLLQSFGARVALPLTQLKGKPE